MILRRPRDAAAVLIPVFKDCPSAIPLVVLLDARRRLVETARADFAVQAIYRIVLARREADTFIVARAACNEQDLAPGPADLALVRNCQAVGRYLYLTLDDYLIIGQRKYWSFKEQGQL